MVSIRFCAVGGGAIGNVGSPPLDDRSQSASELRGRVRRWFDNSAGTVEPARRQDGRAGPQAQRCPGRLPPARANSWVWLSPVVSAAVGAPVLGRGYVNSRGAVRFGRQDLELGRPGIWL